MPPTGPPPPRQYRAQSPLTLPVSRRPARPSSSVIIGAGRPGVQDLARVSRESEGMRFDTKIAIVVRGDLAAWQRLNVTAFLASGVATGYDETIGKPYED